MEATSTLPVRFSHLRAFGKSPAHGKYARSGGEDDPTYAMEKGTAVHAIIFGTRKVVGWEEGRPRRGKDFEDFALRNPDAEILTRKDYDAACYIAEAVARHPKASVLLQAKGSAEKTLLFRRLGRDCRATPDFRTTTYNVELKTTADASPRQFWFHARRMHYHAQMAWQACAIESLGLPVPENQYVVAVESRPPYVVQVYEFGPRKLREGAKLCHLWFERLCASEDADAYPGYSEMVLPLELDEEFESEGASP